MRRKQNDAKLIEEDVRLLDDQTIHAESVVGSSASINPIYTGRAKTETLVESLKAIFEVKPLCQTLA